MKNIKRKHCIIFAVAAVILCFIAHGLGNAMANNGYRSASAIVATSRHQSDRQREIYGPSSMEQASEAYAQSLMRRGENAKSVMNTFSAVMAVLAVVFGVVAYKQNSGDDQGLDKK